MNRPSQWFEAGMPIPDILDYVTRSFNRIISPCNVVPLAEMKNLPLFPFNPAIELQYSVETTSSTVSSLHAISIGQFQGGWCQYCGPARNQQTQDWCDTKLGDLQGKDISQQETVQLINDLLPDFSVLLSTQFEQTRRKILAGHVRTWGCATSKMV